MANELSTIIEGARERFATIAASTPTSVPLNFEREATFACHLLAQNDFSAQIALRSPESLVAAVTQVAAVGLSLNPVSKHAYLVPRKSRSAGMVICLDVGAQGYVELARKAGVKDVWYGLVRERDEFVFPSPGEKVVHRIDPWNDRGELRGAYCQHVLADGSVGQCVVLSRDEIAKRMKASEGWKAHHQTQKASSCIWCSWPDEMALKTVLRYARRWWPQTPELDRAITTLAAADEDYTDGDATDIEPEWSNVEPPAGAIEPPKPKGLDADLLATIHQEIAEACPEVDASTGDPKLLATMLAAYRIRDLADLPAEKATEARGRIQAYHSKRSAKEIAAKAGAS